MTFVDLLARAPWRRLAASGTVIAVSAWFLWRVRAILPPFILALFCAALLDPVVTRLAQRGMSRGRAVALIFAAALGFIVLAGALILPPAIDQVADLGTNISTYAQNLTTSAQNFTERADRWFREHTDTLSKVGITETPSKFVQRQAGPISNAVRDFLDALQAAVISLLGQVLWLIIVPLSLFYFLLDYPAIRARLIGLLPAQNRHDMDRLIQDGVETFGAYVRGLSKVCVLYGSSATVLLWVLRFPYSLFLGIAAGLFYAVPYVGPALAVISIAVIGLTTGKGVVFTLLTVIFFVIMHVTYDYGVTPRVIGGSVGLHPLVNIFALMCGVAMFGVWGMILAVPVAASMKRVLARLYPQFFQPPQTETEERASPTRP